MMLVPKINRPRIGTLREQRAAWSYFLSRRRRSARPFNSPPDIAGLKLWLDAAVGTGAAPADPVAQWNDQSGLGNHASQAEPTMQATLQTNVINGRPVLRFDSDDGYTTPLLLTTPCTVFAVYAFSGNTSDPRRVVQGSNNWLMGPYGLVHEFFNGVGFTGGPAWVTNQFVVQAVWQNASASRNFVNGGFVGAALGAGIAPGTLALGAAGAFGEPIEGDLAEVIAYDSALSDANMTNVWNYLRGRYDL